MVLQQGVPFKLWGIDAPGAAVTAVYRGSSLPPATCDAAGRFELALPAAAATAAPTTISLSSSSGSAPVVLSDIVVGDVYLCSGQSNSTYFTKQTPPTPTCPPSQLTIACTRT